MNFGPGKTEHLQTHATTVGLRTPEGAPVNVVAEYRYLGSWVTVTPDSSLGDWRRRKGLAWAALRKLSPVWRSRMRRDLKVRVFETLVLPVLLYAAETWTVGAALLAEIRGAYTVMVRFVLGVRVCSRETRMTNAQLLRGFPKVEALLLQRRLRFAGHLWRSKEIARDLLFAESPKRYKSRVGRPYLTYPAQLERDTGLRGDELRECMSDRAAWDALVTAKAQELKEAASRPPPGRTSIAPVGTGRGRKRKPLSELSAAARRMRRVNAEKKLAQLVCRVCHT